MSALPDTIRRPRRSMAALPISPSGFPQPLPPMPGAEPRTASYSPTRPPSGGHDAGPHIFHHFRPG